MYESLSGESRPVKVCAQFAAESLDYRRRARPMVRALRPQHQHFLVPQQENRALVVDGASRVRDRVLLLVGPVAAPVQKRVRLEPAVPRSIRYSSCLARAPHHRPLVDLPCVRSEKRERSLSQLQHVRQPPRQGHGRGPDHGAGATAGLCVSKVQARPKTRGSKAQFAGKRTGKH